MSPGIFHPLEIIKFLLFANSVVCSGVELRELFAGNQLSDNGALSFVDHVCATLCGLDRVF